MSKIVIATSLAPNSRTEIQLAAIESWKRLGFEVLSLNSPEEAGKVRLEFGGTECVEIPRSAKHLTGKAVIFINEILDYFQSRDCRICGIVNSDIYLNQNHDLMHIISANAEDTLLFGPRQEVTSFDADDGKMDLFGFDFFFFDRELLRVWPQTKFCLGMPFWDLWFPIVPIFAGRPAKKLIAPIARHIPHPTQRDDTFFMFNNEFVQALLPQLGHTPDGAETFGAHIDGAAYMALVKAVRKSEQLDAPAAEQIAALENLAGWLDEVTRYVIGYIDRNSKKIKIG